jgi:hypothetical protein
MNSKSRIWQHHPSTHTAHAFALDRKPGDLSLCLRETKTSGPLSSDAGIFVCTRCRKKLEKIKT